MCDPSRRTVLHASAAVVAWAVAGAGTAPAGAADPPTSTPHGARPTAPAPKPAIRPRGDWARDLMPTGPLSRERDGDVRFLLVHHTQTPNGYAPDAVPARLRSIFDYHTGTKGWPDVAYNFFVDAHGGTWEGREGSLAGPVKGDATGGSQGFAQLCCFIGDHTASAPTPKAQAAMAALLAWLAGRYDIDLQSGSTITFVSRGSNRWPRGTRVTTTPIAGHRDMSLTECPGDTAYPLVQTALLTSAQRLARSAPKGRASAPKTSATPAPRNSARGTETPSESKPSVTPSASKRAPLTASSDVPSPSATPIRTLDATPSGGPSAVPSVASQPLAQEQGSDRRLPLLAAGLIAAGVAAGSAGVISHRRNSAPDDPCEQEPPESA